MNLSACKGSWVIEGRKGYTQCIFQNRLELRMWNEYCQRRFFRIEMSFERACWHGSQDMQAYLDASFRLRSTSWLWTLICYLLLLIGARWHKRDTVIWDSNLLDNNVVEDDTSIVLSTFRSTPAFRCPSRGLFMKLKPYKSLCLLGIFRRTSVLSFPICPRLPYLSLAQWWPVSTSWVLSPVRYPPPLHQHPSSLSLFPPFPLFLEWRINQAGIVTGLNRRCMLTRSQWLRAFVVNCMLFTALNHEGACFVLQTCRQNHFRLYCCQVKSTKREKQDVSQCHKYSWGEDEQAHLIGELLHFWLEFQVSRSHSLVCYETRPDPVVTHTGMQLII